MSGRVVLGWVLVAGLCAALWCVVAAPTGRGPTWRSCAAAIEVDGALVCDEEIPADVSVVCGPQDDADAPRSGDRIQTDPCVVGRMSPENLEAMSLPVDINTASADELGSLVRIGPALSRRIIAGRPYAKIDDLLQVKGIGPVTLSKIRGRVVVSAP